MGAAFAAVDCRVSLVTADNWIIAHFASKIGGAVSLMTYAKQLFTAPMAVLAQAAGAASMPFFASLWAKEKRFEFAQGVADSVSRVACMGLLAASGMIALGKPAIDLLFIGGRFRPRCGQCASLFCGVLGLAVFMVGAGDLFARVLCGGKHDCADDGGDDGDGDFAANLRRAFPRIWRHGAGVRVGHWHCDADLTIAFCCINGTWYRWRVLIIAKWDDAWLRRLLAGRSRGSCFRGWRGR